MKIYAVRAFTTAMGTVQFRFTAPPTPADIERRWAEWMGDEKELPGHGKLYEQLLACTPFEIDVTENGPPAASVPHPPQRVNNDTVARDSLERRLAEGPDVVELRLPNVDHETRKGCYVSARRGLASATFFVGIGRNGATDPWRQLVENVG